MRANKNFTILNQAVILAFGLLLIQQMIVASSTIWITRLIGSIQDGAPSFFWLGLYLAALFFPYFPGAAALIAMAKAKVKAQVAFVNRFAEVYTGNVLEWVSASHHAKKTSTLTGEAPRTIDGYLDYVYHLASSGLNVALNLLVFALVIDPLFLLSYGIGIGVCFLILRWQKKRKQELSLRSQQSRIKWIEMLLKAWDHILLNNRYNLHIWKEKTDKRGERLKGSALRVESFSQIVSISMAFSLLAPSFLLVCLLAYSRSADLIFLGMLVVILPRLFQILSYSYEMLFSLADFPMQKSRLGTVLNLVDTMSAMPKEEASQELGKRIRWDRISATITNDQEEAQEYAVTALLNELPNRGRITLKGENGSGKTSLLLLLKQKYGEKAFYLPAKHDLLFRFSIEKLSTGQKATRLLEEMIEKADASIILLDEWDANLDRENSIHISKIILKLSSKACVIESRHFREPFSKK